MEKESVCGVVMVSGAVSKSTTFTHSRSQRDEGVRPGTTHDVDVSVRVSEVETEQRQGGAAREKGE